MVYITALNLKKKNFTVEDDDLSVRPRVPFKTCYRRIEKFEATAKEVAN